METWKLDQDENIFISLSSFQQEKTAIALSFIFFSLGYNILYIYVDIYRWKIFSMFSTKSSNQSIRNELKCMLWK